MANTYETRQGRALLLLHFLLLTLPTNHAGPTNGHDDNPEHNSKVLFTKIGSTFSEVEYGNIKIELDLEPTMDALAALANRVSKNAKALAGDKPDEPWNENNHLYPQYIRQARLLDGISYEAGRIETLLRIFEEFVALHHVIPRAVFTLTALLVAGLLGFAAGGATVYGVTYSGSEVEQLDGRVNTLNAASLTELSAIGTLRDDVHNLAALTRNTLQVANQYYVEETNTVMDDHVLTHVHYEVSRTFDILAALGNQRAHPALFQTVDLRETVAQITAFAAERGLVPILTHYTDLMQYPASFSQYKDEVYKINTYVHVPLAPEDGVMTIYQYTALPANAGHGMYVYAGAGDLEVLAISPREGTFKAMTLAMYSQCTKLGPVAYCPKHNVVRRVPDFTKPPATDTGKDPALCLVALYFEQYDYAEAHCTVTIAPMTDIVKQIAPSRFVVYIRTPHQGTVTCRNNSTPHSHRIPIRTATIIDLPAGCQARTDTHIFTSSDAGFTREALNRDVIYEMPLNGLRMTGGIDMKLVAETHKQLGSLIHRKETFNLDEAKAALEKNKSAISSGWHWPTMTFGAAMFLVVIAIMLFLVYKCCASATPTPTPTVSYNPTAPAIAFPTVPGINWKAPPSYATPQATGL